MNVSLCGLLLFVIACEPQLERKERFCPTNFNVVEDLLKPRCTGPSCHAAGVHAAGGLDLESSGLTARLINVPATCGGLRVDVNDPEGSLLLDKVSRQPACGESMPYGGPPLTEGEIACLRQWVDDVTATAGSSPILPDAATHPDAGVPDATMSQGHLMLSEVLYDPTGPDDHFEWVELKNPTGAAIDLANFSLGWGGADYTYGTLSLSGAIPAGGCALIGGPQGGLAFHQSVDLVPDLQNGGSIADGVALFNTPALAITSSTVPIDAVIYGTTNSSGLMDETGGVASVDVGNAPPGSSIQRAATGWVIGTPTPGVCP